MKDTEIKKALDIFSTFEDIFNTMRVSATFCRDVCDCFIIKTNKRVNDTLRYCDMLIHALNTSTNEKFVMFSQLVDNDIHQIIIISVRDIARYYYPELEKIALFDE